MRALPAIVGAALLTLAGSASAAFPTCATGQAPFELFTASTNVVLQTGATSGEACAKYVATSTTSYVSHSDDHICVRVDTATAPVSYATRPIRQVCTLHPDTEKLSAEKVNDYMTLFAAFLLAGVVVLGAKAIYARFRIDHDPA